MKCSVGSLVSVLMMVRAAANTATCDEKCEIICGSRPCKCEPDSVTCDPCPRTCDVGLANGLQTCDEIRQDGAFSCAELTSQGCDCDGYVGNESIRIVSVVSVC